MLEHLSRTVTSKLRLRYGVTLFLEPDGVVGSISEAGRLLVVSAR